MAYNVASYLLSAAGSVWNSIPGIISSPLRGNILTRLFEDTVMFVAANTLLALRGHPSLFIAGYFTGIVLDKAVQEKFEKIKRVALFSLLIPICFGKEAFNYFIQSATFIVACKIGSFLSLAYNQKKKEEDVWVWRPSQVLENLSMLVGSGLLWVLKSPPFLLLSGFFAGSLMEESIEKNFDKVKGVLFGDILIFLGHGWFTAAAFPFVMLAAALVLPAKFGSILSLRYHPKPGGHV